MALCIVIRRQSRAKASFSYSLSRLLTRCVPNNSRNAHSAIVIGCHDNLVLSDVGKAIDEQCGGKISELLKISNFKAKPGKTRVFHGLHKDFPCIAVAGIGAEKAAANELEALDVQKENVRVGIGAAVNQLQTLEVEHAEVDHCSQPTAAAEAATLCSYKFDHLKTKKKKKEPLKFVLSKRDKSATDHNDAWSRGVIMADCQNFARYLMELPSNYKTPRKLADIVVERLAPCKGIEVVIRDKEWMEKKKMGCFLGVAQGSTEPPVLVEIKYSGPADKTVAVVGKGVTFDTGGISIKPSAKMSEMKGDMGGAACTVASIEAACRLGLNLNIVGLMALTENMPSGNAIKPGDVLTAMNGKTVEVDNTDAEGRLILADALVYADSFKPKRIINLATLTGAMRIALGAGAAGTFTNSNSLWNVLNEAGFISGDRLWRMPLFELYSKEMDCSLTADLRNTQKTAGSAGSCTAAAFLKEFVTVDHWAHIDIAGVMTSAGEVPYLGKGMTGRPTRTLVEALEILSR
ncbi:cytosol aminopeptidase-like isoform X3 [Rhopilema esculentum]|uniref:cytosol aminopeptidase-like isoform X1 n=1 Tax=Rhopilema esculentum TaxID=499914 RepID=UPI0031D703DB